MALVSLRHLVSERNVQCYVTNLVSPSKLSFTPGTASLRFGYGPKVFIAIRVQRLASAVPPHGTQLELPSKWKFNLWPFCPIT